MGMMTREGERERDSACSKCIIESCTKSNHEQISNDLQRREEENNGSQAFLPARNSFSEGKKNVSVSLTKFGRRVVLCNKFREAAAISQRRNDAKDAKESKGASRNRESQSSRSPPGQRSSRQNGNSFVNSSFLNRAARVFGFLTTSSASAGMCYMPVSSHHHLARKRSARDAAWTDDDEQEEGDVIHGCRGVTKRFRMSVFGNSQECLGSNHPETGEERQKTGEERESKGGDLGTNVLLSKMKRIGRISVVEKDREDIHRGRSPASDVVGCDAKGISGKLEKGFEFGTFGHKVSGIHNSHKSHGRSTIEDGLNGSDWSASSTRMLRSGHTNVRRDKHDNGRHSIETAKEMLLADSRKLPAFVSEMGDVHSQTGGADENSRALGVKNGDVTEKNTKDIAAKCKSGMKEADKKWGLNENLGRLPEPSRNVQECFHVSKSMLQKTALTGKDADTKISVNRVAACSDNDAVEGDSLSRSVDIVSEKVGLHQLHKRSDQDCSSFSDENVSKDFKKDARKEKGRCGEASAEEGVHKLVVAVGCEEEETVGEPCTTKGVCGAKGEGITGLDLGNMKFIDFRMFQPRDNRQTQARSCSTILEVEEDILDHVTTPIVQSHLSYSSYSTICPTAECNRPEEVTSVPQKTIAEKEIDGRGEAIKMNVTDRNHEDSNISGVCNTEKDKECVEIDKKYPSREVKRSSKGGDQEFAGVQGSLLTGDESREDSVGEELGGIRRVRTKRRDPRRICRSKGPVCIHTFGFAQNIVQLRYG